jgi:hypothetical protein
MESRYGRGSGYLSCEWQHKLTGCRECGFSTDPMRLASIAVEVWSKAAKQEAKRPR